MALKKEMNTTKYLEMNDNVSSTDLLKWASVNKSFKHLTHLTENTKRADLSELERRNN